MDHVTTENRGVRSCTGTWRVVYYTSNAKCRLQNDMGILISFLHLEKYIPNS